MQSFKDFGNVCIEDTKILKIHNLCTQYFVIEISFVLFKKSQIYTIMSFILLECINFKRSGWKTDICSMVTICLNISNIFKQNIFCIF